MEQEVQRRFNEQLALVRDIRGLNLTLEIVSEMQKRVSTKPLDKVAGLVHLLRCESVPIYDAGQSVEDAWEVLMDFMWIACRAELLFFYPEPGNGKKCGDHHGNK